MDTLQPCLNMRGDIQVRQCLSSDIVHSKYSQHVIEMAVCLADCLQTLWAIGPCQESQSESHDYQSEGKQR